MITQQDWYRDRPWLDGPTADIAAYVGAQRAKLPFDLIEKLREWETNGVVLFERAVDPAFIDALNTDLAHLLDHHRDFALGVENSGIQKQLRDCTREELDGDGIKFNSIHSISRAAARLSLTKEVCVFLRHVFRDAPAVLQSLTFIKGSEQPVHLDYPYVRSQTKIPHLAASWIPLEDINPDAGPLAYYPGSHRDGEIGFFDWGGGSILMEPDSVRTPIDFSNFLYRQLAARGLQPKTYLPRKGDVLIWHGALAHEGTRVVDLCKTRRSYVTHYTSLQAYPRSHMKRAAHCVRFLRAAGARLGLGMYAHGGYVFEYPWLAKARKLPS